MFIKQNLINLFNIESWKEERKFFQQIRSNKQTTEDYMRESSELSYIYRGELKHISIFKTNEEDSYIVEESAHWYIKKNIPYSMLSSHL